MSPTSIELTARTTAPVNEQITVMHSRIAELLTDACAEATKAHAGVGKQFAALASLSRSAGSAETKLSEALDAGERAIATRQLAEFTTKLISDDALINALSLFNETARLGVRDLERENETTACKWMQRNLNTDVRARLMELHFESQHLDSTVFEDFKLMAPPAIDLALQAIWAPMHCRTCG